MTDKPNCITDMTAEQIKELLLSLGQPAYRAKQVQQWVYQKMAASFDEMTNLPEGLRQRLAEQTCLHTLKALDEVSDEDGTTKILFALADGKAIESALMPYPSEEGRDRNTVCVSTQVGCPIGCAFCATGQQGFDRNLTTGEIIDQVLFFARRLQNTDDVVTNIVFMGMGEPLVNYDAVWAAIKMLNSPDGFGLGARHMTISTSGVVPGIKRLSQEKLQVGLAISLHATDDDLRNQLVPLNRKYPLKELIKACSDYFDATGRRPTFEYILLAGINDSLKQARALVHLLQKLNCHVNIIPANPTSNKHFQPSDTETVLLFLNELNRLHLNCTLRQARGLEIDAGCGQLRSHYLKQSQQM